VGFVGNVLGFLESEMPYQEKEVILATIPFGGEEHDVGFAVGGGWADLTVKEFLDGKGAKGAEAGFEATDTGFALGVGSLFDRVGPELRLDFRLPDPQMPYYEHDLVLGTIDHGGQSFDWGVRAAIGWPETTLLQMINLPALLKGRFSPVLPEFGATVFFGDVEIDSLQFLPSKFVLRVPALQVTLFGKPVQIVHGGAIEIDTPVSSSVMEPSAGCSMNISNSDLSCQPMPARSPMSHSWPARSTVVSTRSCSKYGRSGLLMSIVIASSQ